MERRQIIIYALFVLAVGYGIYFHFLSGENKKTVARERAPQTESATASLPAPALEVGENTGTELQPPKKYDWGRNPFKNKNAVKAPKKSANVSYIRTPEPRLSAISIDGADTFIVVNNRVITIGEKIGAWRFKKAEKEKALFDGPNGPVWVQLGR